MDTHNLFSVFKKLCSHFPEIPEIKTEVGVAMHFL